jgi:hypothetical protein
MGAEIDAGELVLRPVGQEVAVALLEGRLPAGVVVAPGYPSQFSLEVLQMVARAKVMEKAGMRPCGERIGEVDGRSAALVVHEARPTAG